MDNEVKDLIKKRQTSQLLYMRILQQYDMNDNTCYAVIEGDTDKAYYRAMIQNKIGNKVAVKFIPSGGKKNIKRVYSQLDWNTYSINRLIFFQDNDLHGFIWDKDVVEAHNVYITDCYSFENNVVCAAILEAMLEDVMNLNVLEQSEMTRVLNLFEIQKEVCLKKIAFIMANVLNWKTANVEKMYLSNIKMTKIIRIQNGEIHFIKNDVEIIDYIHDRAKVNYEKYFSQERVQSIYDSLVSNDGYKTYARGKYIYEFFTMFCNSINKDAITMGLTNRKIKRKEIGYNSLVEAAAPRCMLPKSLSSFIDKTFMTYIRSIS